MPMLHWKNHRIWNSLMTQGKIKVLDPVEARRIAAGEVIDRPSSIIREFLDNAIDAGALNIDIIIEEGGCKKIEISDDGSGMNKEDLELCFLTHATSKIRSLKDLETALTLGFRGEALAAVSAVSHLEILSSTDGREAWLLQIGHGNLTPNFKQTQRTKGTTVRALNLFEKIPARKRFLKREGSEGTLCRQAFIDKALAFPQISFRFTQDGKLKDFFPNVTSKKERFCNALFNSEEKFFHEFKVSGTVFNADIIIGGPELYRNDRRMLYIFANGRRINDYSLIQAIEYGSFGWFPNGSHPVGAVFIEIDPAYADFNIHPAKREVRFIDSGAIHHAVSGGVKNFFHSYFLKNSHKKEEKNNRGHGEHGESHGGLESESCLGGELGFEAELDRTEHRDYSYKNAAPTLPDPVLSVPTVPSRESGNSARFIGRLFGLFILIEKENRLYVIDQHAAHERILYNKFLLQDIPKQELLAPIPFCTESETEDKFLEAKLEELSKLGIDIKKDTDGWIIEALPSAWKLSDKETVKEILELKNAKEDIAKRWVATLCCRQAIKDGEILDNETSFKLGLEALKLPDPHCPHGRPVWTEIEKDDLLKAVRRM